MKHLKQFEEYDNKKPFENDLINAVSNNNFEDVKKLVDNGDDINYQKQGDDMTSLIFAAYRQNYKIMDYLINAGAD